MSSPPPLHCLVAFVPIQSKLVFRQLLVDDLLIYNGTLNMVNPAARGILPTVRGPQQYHTILFTNKESIVKREKHTVLT